MLSIDQTQEVIKGRDGLSIIFETPKKQHIIGFASEYNVDGKNFNGMSLY